MNIKERRQRIATLNDISVRDVYMLEQQMILWQIQDALHHNHQIMIHSLNFQDNNDIDDDIEPVIITNDNTQLNQYQDVVWPKNKNTKNNTS